MKLKISQEKEAELNRVWCYDGITWKGIVRKILDAAEPADDHIPEDAKLRIAYWRTRGYSPFTTVVGNEPIWATSEEEAQRLTNAGWAGWETLPELPEPPRWIPFSEKEPTEKDGPTVWIWGAGSSVVTTRWVEDLPPPRGYTHWCRREKLPDLPKPEPTPEELREQEFQLWWKEWSAATKQSSFPPEAVARHMWNSIKGVK